MKKNKRWLTILAVAAVLLLFAVFLVRWRNGNGVSIKTGLVTIGSIEAMVSASGQVDAPVYDLGTKLGGKIFRLKVKEGDVVRSGQLLAEFDNFEQARNDYQRTKQLFHEGAASRQALDAAKTIYEASNIVAPDKGIVAKINFEAGETVVPGSSAITVVNYDKSWVEAQIDEIDIAQVKIGDKVRITSDVYPDKNFAGEIYWIAPLAELRKVGGRIKMDEESYVFPCKIKFLGEHKNLMVNMSVNAEIITKKKEKVLLVPREALISKDDHSTVFVVNKSAVHQTKIETGIRSYTQIEVMSGLTEGQIVAISNVAKLKDGSKIKIEP